MSINTIFWNLFCFKQSEIHREKNYLNLLEVRKGWELFLLSKIRAISWMFCLLEPIANFSWYFTPKKMRKSLWEETSKFEERKKDAKIFWGALWFCQSQEIQKMINKFLELIFSAFESLTQFSRNSFQKKKKFFQLAHLKFWEIEIFHYKPWELNFSFFTFRKSSSFFRNYK